MILLIEGNEFIGDPPAPAKTWGEYFENVFVTSLLSGLRVSALSEDVPETNFGNMAQAVDLKRDDILRMAREAGDDWDNTLPEDKAFLARFAALVAAAEREKFKVHAAALVRDARHDATEREREACAKVCDQFDAENPFIGQGRKCAEIIRARSSK